MPSSSHSPGSTAWCQHFPDKEFSWPLKGWAISFPSLSGDYRKDLLCFHPRQRLAKLRHIVMTRDKGGGQGPLVWNTLWELLLFPVAWSAEGSSGFHHWRSQQPAQPLQTLCRFHWFLPHCFLCSQVPAAWIPLTPSPSTWNLPWQPALASSSAWARCQPRPLWLMPTALRVRGWLFWDKIDI